MIDYSNPEIFTMRFTHLFVLLFITLTPAFSQNYLLTGTVEDPQEEEGIPLATVALLNPEDSTIVSGTTTDLDGYFELEKVKKGQYLIKVQYLGYQTTYLPVNADQDKTISTIELNPQAQTLDEVVILGEATMSTQKGDTTQFNAGAYTTLADASGKDLVEKMPGIMMQDGKLQAQGEDVAKILIDGKPFFGNNVKLALESLPAEIIDKVQVYDKKSDKAELSGFDDGDEARTINIITKPDSKRAQFGRTSGGYGSDDRYELGANVNFFNDDRRITVTGMSNNVNAVSYSADPNSQDEVRTQNGIINTNNIGVQFSNEWNDKLEVSGSYHYSHRNNEGASQLTREYILPSDSGQIYDQSNTQDNLNQDHRFNLRVEYEMDDRNKFIFKPRISLVNDQNNTSMDGATALNANPINETSNKRSNDHQNNDYSGSLLYSHKFDKKGRSLTINTHGGYHTNTDLSYRTGHNIFYNENAPTTEDLNQKSTLARTGISWSARGSFTEGFGDRSMIELEYGIGNRIDDSDKLLYDIYEDPDGPNDELRLDTSLSNTFESYYISQEIELGYQYKIENFKAQAELEYEHVSLQNNQFFPAPFVNDRTVSAFLPTLRLDYEWTKNKNVELNYYTWTGKPSIGQLQSVINDANPLRLSTGNPDLDPTYTHRLRMRFKARNPENEHSFYAGASSRITEDYIANSTFIAEEYTPITDDIALEKGSQLVKPVNVDGYWNLWAYANYGLPLKFIQSNFNVWSAAGLTRRPGVINETSNLSKSTGLRAGISLSSNISDKIDFNISTRSSYNFVDNTLRPQLNNRYFNQRSRIRADWIIWKGLTYRTDISHRMDSGLSDGYNNNVLLVNMSLGKKIMKQNLGEISLKVYDLFNENNNISRNINELYIEDRQNTVLQQYFMLNFTYNIRHFSKGATREDFDI